MSNRPTYTRTVNASTPSNSPLDALRDAFSDDPAATLTVNRFSNFTAYFRAIPPPVPPEYWATLFSISATAVIGAWLIPTSIGWFKSRKQTSRLNFYHQEVVSLYPDRGGVDTTQLNNLNNNLVNEYTAGKINNEQYTNLKDEISVLYHETYKKKIDSLKESPDGDVNREVLMDKIKEDTTDAYSKGKITELHYKLFNEKISKAISKDDNHNSI
jgi:hypothetical protein